MGRSSLILLVVLFGLVGCSSAKLDQRLDDAEFYLDNDLPFKPQRVWRLWVKWEPYTLDEKKAIVVKEFQLLVLGATAKDELESEVRAHGGDAAYLRWFERELVPTGNWESRDRAQIARYKDRSVVTLITRSSKEVPRDGRLRVAPLLFPDRMVRSASDGCHDLNWDVFRREDSVGFEVVLESRDLSPGASRWVRWERDLPNFYWKAWSVGQGRRVAYRTLVFFKTNVARCPLPPRVHAEFNKILAPQEMGIDW